MHDLVQVGWDVCSTPGRVYLLGRCQETLSDLGTQHQQISVVKYYPSQFMEPTLSRYDAFCAPFHPATPGLHCDDKLGTLHWQPISVQPLEASEL